MREAPPARCSNRAPRTSARSLFRHGTLLRRYSRNPNPCRARQGLRHISQDHSVSPCERRQHRSSIAKAGNRDYFRGPEHVVRVRAWRAAHPGYGRKKSSRRRALQEHSSAQPVDIPTQSDLLSAPALQDVSRAQSLVLTGLIAHLSMLSAGIPGRRCRPVALICRRL